MAVDTAAKRYSMIGFGSPVPRMLPIPDGTIAAADRAMLLYLYHGLAVGAVAEPSSIATFVYGPNPNATIFGPTNIGPVEANR